MSGQTRKRSLPIRLLLLFAVFALAGVACGAVVVAAGLWVELGSVAAATLVGVPAALFVLYFCERYGTGPVAILAITGVRFSLTVALAGFVAWKFSSLRTLSFFLSVSVVYLASLYVETWLIWKDYQQLGSSPSCEEHKP